MKAELQALRDGQISFDAFAKQTRNEWERLATRLFRRYKLPAGVEVDDVVQEMMFHAWRAATEWDAARGSNLTRYVTWTAYAEARRWVHQQRNSHRRSDYTPGRFPETFTNWVGDRETTIDNLMAIEPTAEVLSMARRKFAEAVMDLETEGQRIAIEVWAVAGDETGAADLIMKDIRLVSALNLWTPGSAQRLVRTAIEASLRTAAVA